MLEMVEMVEIYRMGTIIVFLFLFNFMMRELLKGGKSQTSSMIIMVGIVSVFWPIVLMWLFMINVWGLINVRTR